MSSIVLAPYKSRIRPPTRLANTAPKVIAIVTKACPFVESYSSIICFT